MKRKTSYVCAECGASALQWFGSCPSCQAVGTLSETAVEKPAQHRFAGRAAESVALEEIEAHEFERIATAELDPGESSSPVAKAVGASL